MTAFWSAAVGTFLATPAPAVLDRLTAAQARRLRTNPLEQLRAWTTTIDMIRAALATVPDAGDWQVLLEYELLRLGRRIDAVLVTPRAIFVLEFKDGADALTAANREQVEDYALDLADFHAASRRHPIIPILVAPTARPRRQTLPLLLQGVAPAVLEASAATLGGLLAELAAALPAPTVPLDPAAWERAPYRPVPTIIEAAPTLYAHHGVAELAAARADTENLARTTAAILAAIARARERQLRVAVFVTGIPGAGKTLCGLNVVFGAGRDLGVVFLTGNPTLVHVLREALARDAAGDRRGALRAARQRMEQAIQALPHFRDHHVAAGEIPAERVAVIDEAQRCWSRAHAIQKTRDRRVRLTDSEPGHLLDIMARQADWSAIICLVGSGQEIHTGEGGLAEWEAALRARPAWQVLAAPEAFAAAAPEPALHLDVPIRSVRGPHSAPWVEAVLAGDAAAARLLAAEVPFLLTRDLAALRAGLRDLARGSRRAGLVASSGAARLRAEGLGAELAHMDAGAVAHWFLDRWPKDVRASDALETLATEFSCQGLELDYVGLCWDGDFLPGPGGTWRVRDFRGTAWRNVRNPGAIAYRINTYRVLLTRARYETILFVPRGSADDATRDPRAFDGLAAFLTACGVRPLTEAAPVAVAPQAGLWGGGGAG
jgi:hypothetical protein